MADKIVISFDEDEKNEKDEKIVVELSDDKNAEVEPETAEISKDERNKTGYKNEADVIQPSVPQKLDSYFRGNACANNFFSSSLGFPEGIHRGFRKKFTVDLIEEFFNSILEASYGIILSSKNGFVYVLDKETGAVKQKISAYPETFEKTGVVVEDKLIVNSLSSVFILENETALSKLYSAPQGYFIWSSLNRYENFIAFIEYNPGLKTAKLKLLDLQNGHLAFEYDFVIQSFLYGSVSISNDFLYLIYDNNLIKISLPGFEASIFHMGIEAGENCILFAAGNKLIVNDKNNSVYTAELNAAAPEFKYIGVKDSYLNSAAGFDDNIFTGTLEGWKYFKNNGTPVYSHDDADENHVRAVSKNILITSKKNRIIFHNLMRFQEAEGFTISSDSETRPQEIIAAVISGSGIYVLSEEGVICGFVNDKLNIQV